VYLGSTLDAEYAQLLRLVVPVTTLALFDGTMTDATALKVRLDGLIARSPATQRQTVTAEAWTSAYTPLENAR
jgi:hypothetical protein